MGFCKSGIVMIKRLNCKKGKENLNMKELGEKSSGLRECERGGKHSEVCASGEYWYQ